MKCVLINRWSLINQALVFTSLLILCLSSPTGAQLVEPGSGSAALVPVTVNSSSDGRAILTVSWLNSWRDSIPSERGNHDGVWVFAKRGGSDGIWHHQHIDRIESSDGYAIDRATDGTGAFVFRDRPGTGVATVRVTIWWRTTDAKTSVIRVFAWPMVWIPPGAFYLGDGDKTTPGRFYAGGTDGQPYRVDGSRIWLSPEAGGLWADNTRSPLPAGALGPSPWEGDSGFMPDSYPLGHRAFWIMCYETTQGQYADFLNTLSPSAARRRAPSSLDFSSGGRVTPDNYRFTLSAKDGNWSAAQPLWSMNWIDWDDGCAMADWAGFRPMTELEYEKAARGPAKPIPGEYAWGSRRIEAIRGFDAKGRAMPASANASYSPTTQDRPLLGPYAAGALSGHPSREARGESFWGVSDLSGNVIEMAVSSGMPQGREFIPNHGDGELSSDGSSDVASWPRITDRSRPFGNFGFGYRGGDFYNPETDLRVSSRNVANFGGTRRLFGLGFRAVSSQLIQSSAELRETGK